MDDIVLIESASLRKKLCKEEYTSILERLGELLTLPGTGWTTIENASIFYEVTKNTIEYVIKRNKKEFISDGYKILKRKDLENWHDASFEIKIPNRGLAILPRRGMLRLGMLLRDSNIAKMVRTYLLELEEKTGVILSDKKSLQKMATQLEQQAIQVAKNANNLTTHAQQLSQNAEQLISQAEIVKAVVNGMYQNREHIQKLEAKVEQKFSEHEKRITALELNPHIELDDAETISPAEIDILKARVKAKGGKPISIWRKFNRHFNITRYRFLPRHRFGEALEWIESYE